jgi:hypothetical protein
MHRQLWGYKVEEKLYLGVSEQKRLNTAGLGNPGSQNILCISANVKTINSLFPLSLIYLSMLCRQHDAGAKQCMKRQSVTEGQEGAGLEIRDQSDPDGVFPHNFHFPGKVKLKVALSTPLRHIERAEVWLHSFLMPSLYGGSYVPRKEPRHP